MDPITAVGLAGSIVQFLDFTSNFVVAGFEISRLGGTSKNLELQSITTDFDLLTQKLSYRVKNDDGLPTCLCQEDQALENLSAKCSKLAKELSAALARVIRTPGHGKCIYLRQLLRTVWSEKEIVSLSKRLESLRDELQFHLTHNIRRRLDQKILDDDAWRKDLNEGQKRIIEAISNQRDVFDQILEERSSRIESLLKVDETLASTNSMPSATEIQNPIGDVDNIGRLDEIKQFSKFSPSEIPEDATSEMMAHQRASMKAALPKFLHFEQSDYRRQDLPDAHRATFRWIFEKDRTLDNWDNFAQWLETGNDIYWLNGKAGSGKSCLMKYILQAKETSEYLSSWLPTRSQLIMANFFLWNSGVQMQKSQIGLLRSLLGSICAANMTLGERLFEEWFEKSLARNHFQMQEAAHQNKKFSPPFFEPSEREIVRAFSRLSKIDFPDTKIFLLIDGIDELEGNVSTLIEHLKAISGPSLKIVVSSRPIPECVESFVDAAKLRLQDLTQFDMQLYVHDKIGGLRQMQHLKEKDAKAVHSLNLEIASRSSGVFLWTVLVVRSLVAGLRGYDTIEELFIRLDELPRELEDLYKHMLKSLNPFYREQASKLLQITYEAAIRQIERPLDAVQLHFASSMAAEAVFLALSEPLTASEKYSICEQIEGRLRSRCRGLLEIGSQNTVVFLHRTVREFLQQPEIWSYIASLNLDTNFDVNLVLMSSCINILKTHSSQKMSDSTAKKFKILASTALQYAAIYERESCKSCWNYLQELDKAMTYCWDQARRLNQGEFRQSTSKAGAFKRWTTYFVAEKVKRQIATNSFLTVLISRGLVHSLLECLSGDKDSSAGGLRPEQDCATLFNVLSKLRIPERGGEQPQFVNEWSKLLRVLLHLGCDPNRSESESSSCYASDISVWENFLLDHSKYESDVMDRLLQVFVESGMVDVNVDLLCSGYEGNCRPLDILKSPRQREILLEHGAVFYLGHDNHSTEPELGLEAKEHSEDRPSNCDKRSECQQQALYSSSFVNHNPAANDEQVPSPQKRKREALE